MGIILGGEKYVWTNRRRLSSQQPFENAGDVKAENAKSLKELKFKYSQCVEERKLPFVIFQFIIFLKWDTKNKEKTEKHPEIPLSMVY